MSDAYYIVILQSVVGDGINYPWETVFSSDWKKFGTRKTAIAHGFTLDCGDDFTLGRIKDGRLLALYYMEEENDLNHDLEKISKYLGLRQP